MTSISIIIPTLQEEACLRTLLTAILAQEYSGPLQIIVVDGASIDKTPQIAAAFENVELIVTQKPNTGKQRNLAAIAATGELLIFMDADDLPPRHFLSSIASSYRKRPFAVACPWFVADTRNPLVRLIYFNFNLLFWLSQWHFHTGSGVCIITPREVFLNVGGFDERLHLGEDIHYIRRAAALGRHRHLPIPLRTSGRRFEERGIWNLVKFYARISPPLLRGDFEALRDIPYPAAPYKQQQ